MATQLAVSSPHLAADRWGRQSYYRTNKMHRCTGRAWEGRGVNPIGTGCTGRESIDQEVKPDNGGVGDADEEDYLGT